MSAPGQAVVIGHGYSSSAGFQALSGDIAEMVAVQGSVSAADLTTLECHMLLKYDLGDGVPADGGTD